MEHADPGWANRIFGGFGSGESVVDAILKLVRSGRPETTDIQDVKDQVAWGPGPRASQALMQAVRARARSRPEVAPSWY